MPALLSKGLGEMNKGPYWNERMDSFCPLCGAHPKEHGEGEEANLLLWEKEITELYQRLLNLKKESE